MKSMSVVNMVMSKIKTAIVNWLNFEPAPNVTITIIEPFSFEGNVMKNRIWYRGEPSELSQFYKQMCSFGPDDVNSARFWAAVPSSGLDIRKIHSGLPGICVDKMADIVTSDMEPITFDGVAPSDASGRWEPIAEENDWNTLIHDAIKETDITGDGAFKISFDPAVSELPIIEFYSGERVGYTRKRGRVTEVLFYTSTPIGNRIFKLQETYGKGYITYQLFDDNGNSVDPSQYPETAKLVPVHWAGDFMLAVPMMFSKSAKFEGRGKSLLDNKCDMYDALDEDISQWTDAVRNGRVMTYIPEDLIPVDPETGEKLAPNPFDNRFIGVGNSAAENSENKIQREQAQINSDEFQQKYTADLDLCLQGVLSPATLGIDLAKKDNADAQREKEKVTQYSRGQRIDVLQKVLPKLVDVVLKSDDLNQNSDPQDYPCSAGWGEYASPSFDAVVTTVTQARTAGVMSIEQAVEEMYGDTMDKTAKSEEVARIKNEQGITSAQEPSVGDEMNVT